MLHNILLSLPAQKRDETRKTGKTVCSVIQQESHEIKKRGALLITKLAAPAARYDRCTPLKKGEINMKNAFE